MSVLDVTKTVADITRHVPNAARVFEHLGIDYFCRGHELLIDAVHSHSLSIDDVVEQLSEASRDHHEDPIPTELEALIALIVDRHHATTKKELERLPRLANKVRRIHSHSHPELRVVQTLVETLTSDLAPHMLKEERILFPYIASLARGERPGAPFFTRLESPIAAIENEHEAVGETLGQLERVTSRYRVPEDADASYRTLYRVLRTLQADLHRHIYLENYVLFPQARALERYMLRSTG